jgi:hypothetical protein
MPDCGLIDCSVLFLVSVAAEEFILELDGYIPLFSFFSRIGSFLNFTCDAWVHIAHQIMELLFLNTGLAEILAAAADRFAGFAKGAAQLAGRADIAAASTLAANIGFPVEGSSDAPLFTPSPKSDGFRHHLFRAHPDTQSAPDTVLVFLTETLLVHSVGRSQVLYGLRLRAGCQEKLQDHPASFHDPRRGGAHPQSFLHRIGAGRNQPARRLPADFHDTEPAGAIRRQCLVMAESGYGESKKPRRFQDCRPFFHGNSNIIDAQGNHNHLRKMPLIHFYLVELADAPAIAAPGAYIELVFILTMLD